MLSQYIEAALTVGPLVWLFFYMYHREKLTDRRRALLAGVLYGGGVGGLITLAVCSGHWTFSL